MYIIKIKEVFVTKSAGILVSNARSLSKVKQVNSGMRRSQYFVLLQKSWLFHKNSAFHSFAFRIPSQSSYMLTIRYYIIQTEFKRTKNRVTLSIPDHFLS